MNDDEVLTAVRDSLTAARDSLENTHMTRPVAAITGTARRRRMRYGAMGIGTAALGVGLAAVLTTGGGSAAPPDVHVNLAAWSVNTEANGTVQVTVRQLENPDELRAVLARAGVPAAVTVGAKPCRGPQFADHTAQLAQIVHSDPLSGSTVALTITPSAIPKGDELELNFTDFKATVRDRYGVVAIGLVPVGSCPAHP